MSSLPDKPSELIRVALADLAKVEADPRYVVDMGMWHEPLAPPFDGKCAVCLAGAVMAGTLGISAERSLRPEDFDDDTNRKLDDLDEMRLGWVPDRFDFSDHGRPITKYADNPARFRADMERFASDLEEAGL